MSQAESPATIHVPVEQVRELLIALLVGQSLFRFDAETVADRLIDADLRGRHAHGAASVRGLLAALAAGDCDPRGRVLTVHETAALAVLDGSRAAGPIAGTRGMQTAIALAQRSGTGTVVVGNSQPLPAPSVYALLAAQQGLIGCVVTSSGTPTIVPCGGCRPGLLDAVWSWAAPVAGRPPFVVESACGIPAAQERAVSGLAPVAGAIGMGLSVLASLLTTGLAGGRPVHRRVRPGTAEDSQHYFQAIDPGAFCDAGRFARDLAAYLDELRGQSSAPGSAPLSLPGDNGSTRAESIREEGIPVPADLYAELRRWDPDGGDAAPRR